MNAKAKMSQAIAKLQMAKTAGEIFIAWEAATGDYSIPSDDPQMVSFMTIFEKKYKAFVD
mgnify:CR=1 FL=1